MPINISPDQLARLQKNLGQPSQDLPVAAAVTDSKARKRAKQYQHSQGPENGLKNRATGPRKANRRDEPIEWVLGMYAGRRHYWRVVDAQRWLTACGHEVHRPGWRPQARAQKNICRECVTVLEALQSAQKGEG